MIFIQGSESEVSSVGAGTERYDLLRLPLVGIGV
jgi:hypothetical protein